MEQRSSQNLLSPQKSTFDKQNTFSSQSGGDSQHKGRSGTDASLARGACLALSALLQIANPLSPAILHAGSGGTSCGSLGAFCACFRGEDL